MNILDENVPASQARLLRNWRIRVRQIGEDIARKGMKDDQIIPLLHRLDRPTFFTLDEDFYNRRLCHQGYCLVHLSVEEETVADFIRRFLRHGALDSKAKRMGLVIRVQSRRLSLWRIRQNREIHLAWR